MIPFNFVNNIKQYLLHICTPNFFDKNCQEISFKFDKNPLLISTNKNMRSEETRMILLS